MTNKVPVFQLSVPTPAQLVKSAERVAAVFLVAGFTVWIKNGQHLNKAAALAAVAAGVTAVYQLVVSSVTTL